MGGTSHPYPDPRSPPPHTQAAWGQAVLLLQNKANWPPPGCRGSVVRARGAGVQWCNQWLRMGQWCRPMTQGVNGPICRLVAQGVSGVTQQARGAGVSGPICRPMAQGVSGGGSWHRGSVVRSAGPWGRGSVVRPHKPVAQGVSGCHIPLEQARSVQGYQPLPRRIHWVPWWPQASSEKSLNEWVQGANPGQQVLEPGVGEPGPRGAPERTGPRVLGLCQLTASDLPEGPSTECSPETSSFNKTSAGPMVCDLGKSPVPRD